MRQQVEAVYEHGVLSRKDLELVERARMEVAALDSIPTIEEVRCALASIKGALSEDVIAGRGDY